MSEKDPSLRVISGVIAFLAIFADVTAVTLFIRDIFLGSVSFTFASAIIRTLIIIATFTFAVLLYIYSRQYSKKADGVFAIFGWVYAVLSALMFAGISYQFIYNAEYGLSEYLGYILLVLLIASLGSFIALTINSSIKYFSVPFMLVGLEQIVLWIILIFNNHDIVFNGIFIGNILLFAIAGLFILFFLAEGLKVENPATVLILVVGSIIGVMLIIQFIQYSPRLGWIVLAIIAGGILFVMRR